MVIRFVLWYKMGKRKANARQNRPNSGKFIVVCTLEAPNETHNIFFSPSIQFIVSINCWAIVIIALGDGVCVCASVLMRGEWDRIKNRQHRVNEIYRIHGKIDRCVALGCHYNMFLAIFILACI